MGLTDSINILGMRLDMVQMDDVIKLIEQWILGKNYGNYIVISNANDAFISRNHLDAREAVNNSSLSVPDGISLVLLARLYGYNLKRRVCGSDLMLKFLETAQDKGYSNFFYGSSTSTLNLLILNLKSRFPRLKIAGSYSPPFRELTTGEEEVVAGMINKLSPDILWVGLGCPKQQLWMFRHKNKLNVPVMLGIGAAFDFLSGAKKRAPAWIRDNGFEWLFRLVSEPKRLWRRYLINGSLFVYYAGKEALLKSKNSNRGPYV